MIELGRGAVNMVHKVVGTGSSYLTPYAPYPKPIGHYAQLLIFRSLLEAYTGYECLHSSLVPVTNRKEFCC